MGFVTRSRRGQPSWNKRVKQTESRVDPFRRKRSEQGRGCLLKGRWKQPKGAPDPSGQVIAIVAAKEFISAVAGKTNRNATAGQLGDQIGRDLRGVREWLIVHSRKQWNNT